MMDKVQLAFEETGEIDLTSTPKSQFFIKLTLQNIQRRRTRRDRRNTAIERGLLLECQKVCHRLSLKTDFQRLQKSRTLRNRMNIVIDAAKCPERHKVCHIVIKEVFRDAYQIECAKNTGVSRP